MTRVARPYEIVFVNDGSRDGSAAPLRRKRLDLRNQLALEAVGFRGQVIRGRRLRDVVGCALLQRLHADVGVPTRQRRRHDDLGVGTPREELRKRRQAVHHRHLDVEHDDVEILAIERVQRLLPVRDRGRHPDFRIRLQGAGERAADDRGVVAHHHGVVRRRGVGGPSPRLSRAGQKTHRMPTCANFD